MTTFFKFSSKAGEKLKRLKRERNQRDFLTIRPVASKGYGSVAREAKPQGAIDPWPLRAKGLIVLVSPNWSDRKSNKKVRKCKLKKGLFRNKTKESETNFATR